MIFQTLHKGDKHVPMDKGALGKFCLPWVFKVISLLNNGNQLIFLFVHDIVTSSVNTMNVITSMFPRLPYSGFWQEKDESPRRFRKMNLLETCICTKFLGLPKRHLCFQKSFYDRSEGLEALSKGLDWELDRCGLRETMDDHVCFSVSSCSTPRCLTFSGGSSRNFNMFQRVYTTLPRSSLKCDLQL